MSRHRPFLRLTLGALIVAGMGWSVFGPAPAAFTPYIPQVLPQNAHGDFDGDGRPDVALIEDGGDGANISIALSGSSAVIYLAGEVDSLVAGDIDGDGDLDLVAVARTGTLVAWLNDGHGVFTRQRPSPPNNLSADAVTAGTSDDEPVAVVAAAPLVAPSNRRATADPVTLIPSELPSSACDAVSASLPSLRGPPPSVSLS